MIILKQVYKLGPPPSPPPLPPPALDPNFDAVFQKWARQLATMAVCADFVNHPMRERCEIKGLSLLAKHHNADAAGADSAATVTELVWFHWDALNVDQDEV